MKQFSQVDPVRKLAKMGSNPGCLIPNSTPIALIESYLLVDRGRPPRSLFYESFLRRNTGTAYTHIGLLLWSQKPRYFHTRRNQFVKAS